MVGKLHEAFACHTQKITKYAKTCKLSLFSNHKLDNSYIFSCLILNCVYPVGSKCWIIWQTQFRHTPARTTMHFQRKLKVGALLDSHLTTETENVFQMLDVRFIKLLSFALGFDYQLVPPIDGEVGRKYPNGTWTGFVGMVNRSELDFAATSAAITEQRMEGAAWSFPFSFEPVTFATLKPQYKTQLDSYLLPFTRTVWIALVASLIIVSIVLHGVSNRRFGFQRTFLSTYSAILQKSMGVPPAKASEYFVVSSWIIGMAFFSYCYTALLLSFMSIPTLTGVRTVSELAAEVEKGSYKCYTVPGAFVSQVLLQSTNPGIQIIGRDLQQNPGTRDGDSVVRGSTEKVVHAFIRGAYQIQHLSVDYFVSSDKFFNAYASIPMQRSFCCKEELNKVIHHIMAAGFYTKIHNDEIYKETYRFQMRPSDVQQSDASHRVLTVADFKGAFIFLIFGHTLSSVVFVIEKCFSVRQKRKRRVNSITYYVCPFSSKQ